MRFGVGETVRHLQNHHTGEAVEARQRKGARPEYAVDFGDGEERRVDELDLEDAETPLRSYEHAENVYFRHQAREDWLGEGHPDGCFFCGSHMHPSDCCLDTRAVDEYWEEMA